MDPTPLTDCAPPKARRDTLLNSPVGKASSHFARSMTGAMFAQ
jgi:hypothetical protein